MNFPDSVAIVEAGPRDGFQNEPRAHSIFMIPVGRAWQMCWPQSLTARSAVFGGCPASRTAGGNIATEDLVGMLHEMGIDAGIDLDALIACARYARQITGRNLPGHLISAGKVNWQVSDW